MNKKKIALYTVGGLVVFGLGAASGGSKSAEPVAAPEPAPTVTATVQASPSPAVTVTAEPVVETKEVTPAVCIEALDLAGTAIGTLSELPGIAQKAIQAAYLQDAAGLEAQTSQTKALNERITDQTPELTAAVQACRAGAE
jgi:hypothetical protein